MEYISEKDILIQQLKAALEDTLDWMRDDLGLDDDSPEVAPVIAAIAAAKGE